MLRNLSYNNPQVNREVRKAVGESFSWMERLRQGGTGSAKLPVIEASAQIVELMELDNYLNYCNIEICKYGVIIRFRSLLETYGLVIPFYQLSLYKGESDSYSIFCGEHKIKVKIDHPKTHGFFKRLLELKVKQSGSRVDDL